MKGLHNTYNTCLLYTSQEKWSDILNMIKIEHDVSDVSFNAWLEPLEVYKVEGNVVTIIVTNGRCV